jgi:catechol 2,3-dioxygenase-like lactoylglutathione lyase family enzyme
MLENWSLLILSCLVLATGVAAQGSNPAKPGPEVVTVRYQVADTKKSVDFYTKQLNFVVTLQSGPFASVKRGNLQLILSGPGTSGARPMPDGRKQSAGGWNRIVIYVDDLEGHIDRLKKAKVRFRNNIESGPGGSQILIDDPDGNPIELHEAPRG